MYTLDDLTNKFGVDPLALRMLCLQSNYGDKLNFTERSIKDAQNTLDNLRNFVNRVSQIDGAESAKDTDENITLARKEFRSALENNLNTSKALAAVFQFITDTNKLLEVNRKGAKDILNFISEIDEILGLNLAPEKATVEVRKLFADYQNAKKAKDWAKSDELRKKISELGWVAEDTKCDSILRKK